MRIFQAARNCARRADAFADCATRTFFRIDRKADELRADECGAPFFNKRWFTTLEDVCLSAETLVDGDVVCPGARRIIPSSAKRA